MATLTRDEILSKQGDVPTKKVEVPDWDGVVRVRCLSTKARLKWALNRDKALAGDPDVPDPTAYLVTLGAIDDNGALLFQIQDCDALSVMRGDYVDLVSDAILELSGMTDKAAVDAEKNSATSPSGDSPIESPVTSDAPSESSGID